VFVFGFIAELLVAVFFAENCGCLESGLLDCSASYFGVCDVIVAIAIVIAIAITIVITIVVTNATRSEIDI
jgi:hypothetical protein